MSASSDHVKGKPLEVLAVNEPEVGVFLRQYSLTSIFATVRTEKKKFQERKYIGCHKNPKINQKPEK